MEPPEQPSGGAPAALKEEAFEERSSEPSQLPCRAELARWVEAGEHDWRERWCLRANELRLEGGGPKGGYRREASKGEAYKGIWRRVLLLLILLFYAISGIIPKSRVVNRF
jgi:hypothetical protein